MLSFNHGTECNETKCCYGDYVLQIRDSTIFCHLNGFGADFVHIDQRFTGCFTQRKALKYTRSWTVGLGPTQVIFLKNPQLEGLEVILSFVELIQSIYCC